MLCICKEQTQYFNVCLSLNSLGPKRKFDIRTIQHCNPPNSCSFQWEVQASNKTLRIIGKTHSTTINNTCINSCNALLSNNAVDASMTALISYSAKNYSLFDKLTIPTAFTDSIFSINSCLNTIVCNLGLRRGTSPIIYVITTCEILLDGPITRKNCSVVPNSFLFSL